MQGEVDDAGLAGKNLGLASVHTASYCCSLYKLTNVVHCTPKNVYFKLHSLHAGSIYIWLVTMLQNIALLESAVLPMQVLTLITGYFHEFR